MAKSVIDEALASIDADIAALQRAKDIIIAAASKNDVDAPPKVRKPRKKRSGMPEPAQD